MKHVLWYSCMVILVVGMVSGGKVAPLGQWKADVSTLIEDFYVNHENPTVNLQSAAILPHIQESFSLNGLMNRLHHYTSMAVSDSIPKCPDDYQVLGKECSAKTKAQVLSGKENFVIHHAGFQMKSLREFWHDLTAFMGELIEMEYVSISTPVTDQPILIPRSSVGIYSRGKNDSMVILFVSNGEATVQPSEGESITMKAGDMRVVGMDTVYAMEKGNIIFIYFPIDTYHLFDHIHARISLFQSNSIYNKLHKQMTAKIGGMQVGTFLDKILNHLRDQFKGYTKLFSDEVTYEEWKLVREEIEKQLKGGLVEEMGVKVALGDKEIKRLSKALLSLVPKEGLYLYEDANILRTQRDAYAILEVTMAAYVYDESVLNFPNQESSNMHASPVNSFSHQPTYQRYGKKAREESKEKDSKGSGRTNEEYSEHFPSIRKKRSSPVPQYAVYDEL